MRRYGLLAAAFVALAVGVPLAGGETLDPIAPAITSSTPSPPANNNNPVLNGTADPGSAIVLFTDNTCTGTVVGTGWANESGVFEIAVAVDDNTSTTFYAATESPPLCSQGFTYVEDSVEAAPSIATHPFDPTSSSDATFTFLDPDPAVAYSCQLDGGAVSDCSSGSQQYAGLQDGRHIFNVTARDAAGNVSDPATFAWTIDTINPLVTLTAVPQLVTNQTSASFSFTAADPASTFTCSLDGDDFMPCASPKLYPGLGRGPHTFAVRAKAPATSPAFAQYTWTIDTVAPETAISSAPPAQSNSPSASFAFTSSEPGSSFVCSLDSAGFTPCSSPTTYSGLGDGTHVFRVQAVDPAGNADASAAAYSWQISGVGPPIADHVPPGNVSRLRRNVDYGRLQLRWRKPADPDFDHVGVYVSTRPRNKPRTLVYKGKRQTYTNKRFKNGLYYRYLVVTYDHANNASLGKTTLVPPSVLLTSPRNGRILRSPPILRWNPVRRATFYNVQVYHRGQKILSTWPGKARQRLSRRWQFGGHSFALRRGVYTWYVWPAFGPRSKSRYGQLLGQGMFRVR